MKKYYRIVGWSALCAAVMIPLVSRATALCPTATLETVIGLGSCTIGGSTITFGPAHLSGDPIYYNGPFAGDTVYAPSSSHVTFTPMDAANNPGFTLSGAFSVTGARMFMDAEFGYLSVAAPAGSKISGTSIALTGANVSAPSNRDFTNYVAAWLNGLAVSVSGDGTKQLSNANSFAPIATKQALIELRAYDYSSDANGVAGFSGVTFNFALASDTPKPPTTAPEPASLALLGLGLAGIGTFRKRRTKR